jgi:hypothetical protein
MRISLPEGSSQDPSGFLCYRSILTKNHIFRFAIARDPNLKNNRDRSSDSKQEARS